MLRIDRPRIATTVHQLAAGLLRSRLLMGYMALGILSGFGNGGPAGLIAGVVNYGLLAVYGVIAFLWTEKDARPVERKQEMATVASRRRDATVIVVVVFAFAFGFAAWFWSHGLPFDVYWSVRHGLAGAGWNPALAAKAANAVVISAETVVLFALAMPVFRLRPGELGLVPRRIMLGLVLAAAKEGCRIEAPDWPCAHSSGQRSAGSKSASCAWTPIAPVSTCCRLRGRGDLPHASGAL